MPRSPIQSVVRSPIRSVFGNTRFTAQSLFRNGEEGAIIGADRLELLYDDSSKTTPHDGDAGDPVGAAVDQSGNGNDALQSTAGSRPLYGIRPPEIRNLLQRSGTPSEDFSGAGWNKSNLSVTSEGDTIPIDGVNVSSQRVTLSGGLAQHFMTDSDAWASGEAGGLVAWVVDVSNLTTKFCVLFATQANVTARFTWTAAQTISVTNPEGGAAFNYEILGDYQALVWMRFTAARSATAQNAIFFGNFGNYSGDGEYATVARVQTEFATAPTPYQKVVSQYEVTESGQPNVYELVGDGSADYLAGSIPSADYQAGFMIAGSFRHLTGSVSGNETILSVGNSGSAATFDLFISNADSEFQVILNLGAGTSVIFSGPALDAEKHVFIAYFDESGNVNLIMDGVTYTSSLSMSAVSFNQFGILAFNRTTVGNYANAAITKAVIMDRVPTATEIQNLGSSLANEVGATWV